MVVQIIKETRIIKTNRLTDTQMRAGKRRLVCVCVCVKHEIGGLTTQDVIDIQTIKQVGKSGRAKIHGVDFV